MREPQFQFQVQEMLQFACEKVLDLGGKPVTMSDSSGFIHDPEVLIGRNLPGLWISKIIVVEESLNMPTNILVHLHTIPTRTATNGLWEVNGM